MFTLVLALMVSSGPRLEGFVGASQSAPTTVSIAREGQPTVFQRAEWDNQPFQLPPYWLVRAGWDFGRWELSLELVHHKLILANPRAPIDRFAVSHGFNLVLATAAVRVGGQLVARAGAGLVVAHPESSVSGAIYGATGPYEGEMPAGAAATVGLERRIPVWRWVSVVLSTAATAAWISVPVAGGHAELPDVAVHVRLGLGVGPEGPGLR